jgi:hypothetical protein
VTITDGTQSSATLMDDGEMVLGNAFAFTVNPKRAAGNRRRSAPRLRRHGYSDFQYIQVALEPLYETHDVGALEVSLTGTGGIGWIGWPGWRRGGRLSASRAARTSCSRVP